MYAGRVVEIGRTERVFREPEPSLHPRPPAGGAHRRDEARASHGDQGHGARTRRSPAVLPLRRALPQREGRLPERMIPELTSIADEHSVVVLHPPSRRHFGRARRASDERTQ